eukprot:243619-Alexandrium_andersonii.AAC.1
MLLAQNQGLTAIGEFAVNNDQRSKKDDIDLALKQIRVRSWGNEDERERRVAVERWMGREGWTCEK